MIRAQNFLQALVGHVVQIVAAQIRHHHAIGAIIADILAVDPNHLVAVEPYQQRFDIAIGRMSGIDHCADAVAADQFDALANQIGVALDDDPMTFGPQIAVIGSAFRGIAGAQVFIVGDTIFIICLCRLMLLQLILIVLLLLLILLLLGLILGVIGGGRTLRRGRRL